MTIFEIAVLIILVAMWGALYHLIKGIDGTNEHLWEIRQSLDNER